MLRPHFPLTFHVTVSRYACNTYSRYVTDDGSIACNICRELQLESVGLPQFYVNGAKRVRQRLKLVIFFQTRC